MLPVLRWEVEEGEQHAGVLLQGRDGLRIFGPVLAGEPRDRLARPLPRFGVHDLAERGLHARLEPPRELVDDVAELVEPVPLLARLRPYVAYGRPEPEGTVPDGDHGRAHAPPLQVAQHGLPALGALAILDGDQLLSSDI